MRVIHVLRKPCSEPTVAANVLKHGTGAINVNGCRVGTETTVSVSNGNSGAHGIYGRDTRVFRRENPPGRWPANLVLGACLDSELEEVFPIGPGDEGSAARYFKRVGED